MASKQWKTVSALVVVSILNGVVIPNEADAASCGAPSSLDSLYLDSLYDSATTVVTARLISSSVSETLIANSKFEAGFLLKSESANELIFDIDISSTSSCGPDLIMGKSYILFIIEEKPALVPVDDPKTYRWLLAKLQTRGSE